MRHGIEVRPNGNKIITHTSPAGFKEYIVFLKTVRGFIRTANGPWTYLYNARNDADNGELKWLPMTFVQIDMLKPIPKADSCIFTTGREPAWLVSDEYRGVYEFHIQTLAIGESYTCGHGTFKRMGYSA